MTSSPSSSTLISAARLREALDSAQPPIVLDVRFDLADPDAGEAAYQQGHLPGAHHLHLDRDLAGPKNGRNGRHPLPAFEAWQQTVAARGVTPATPQVVVYDNQQGMFAARAWWMTRQLGVPVAVLDGGLDAWVRAGGTLTTEVPARRPTPAARTVFPPGAWQGTVQADELLAPRAPQPWLVLDARAPERYRGDTEPLDRVAGHIPGARNRFFRQNLTPEGLFKPAEALRAEFMDQLGDTQAAEVVHQCGSGVTACHNLLAMAIAGLGTTHLYPGSWSEWCSDPARPVAQGDG